MSADQADRTMVDRLSLALCNSWVFDCFWKKTGENVEASKQCASCRSIASVVLKEIREPSKAIIELGGDGVWQAMIDRILSEGYAK